eukprot:12906019-Prorocentrum_lima.AAC.1
MPAAYAPKKSRRPRSNKPPQHENDRGIAAPGFDKGGKGGEGKWDRARTPASRGPCWANSHGN